MFIKGEYNEYMEHLINYITETITSECLLHGCSGDIRKLQKQLKILKTFVSESRIGYECLRDMERPPYLLLHTPVDGVVRGYVDNQTERPFDTDCVITGLEKTVSRLLDTVSVCKTKVKAHANSEYDLGDYYTPEEQIKVFQDIMDKKDPEIFNYKSIVDVKYESIPDTNSYLTKEELEGLYATEDGYDPKEELEDLKKLGWIIPED